MTPALGALAALVSMSIPALGAGEQRVTVEISGFDSSAGRARCGLFVEDGWGDEDATRAGVEARIADGAATCIFEAVPPGRYAVGVYHDANGNRRMDKNFLGIPSEAYCFSEGAKGRRGPPDFSKAAFEVENAPVVTSCKL